MNFNKENAAMRDTHVHKVNDPIVHHTDIKNKPLIFNDTTTTIKEVRAPVHHVEKMAAIHRDEKILAERPIHENDTTIVEKIQPVIIHEKYEQPIIHHHHEKVIEKIQPEVFSEKVIKNIHENTHERLTETLPTVIHGAADTRVLTDVHHAPVTRVEMLGAVHEKEKVISEMPIHEKDLTVIEKI